MLFSKSATRASHAMSWAIATGRLRKPVTPRSLMRSTALALATVVSLNMLSGGRETLSANPGQTDYTLGTSDRVRIRVFEWRPARDEVHEWAALNSEYAVGANGRISMPLIGEVAASGISPADLARTIGLRLKTRMGLAEAPDIAVEVTQYRPFYISGYVEKPGEFPYRPGLTVGQALALSGGLLRSGEYGSQRLDREFIQTNGDLALVSHEFNHLLARRARLEAEASGRTAITFPPALLVMAETQSALQSILNQEREVFRTRRETFSNQVETLGQLLSFLDEELKGIAAQINSHKKQTGLVQDELKDVSGLLAKGISTKPRKTNLERHVGQMESEGIRLETSLMRVRQDKSRTMISMNELHNKRITDTTSELRDTQSRLQSLAHRSDTLERLLNDTFVTGSLLQTSNDADSPRPQSTLKVQRVRSGQPIEIEATEATPVEPGDSIKVEAPPRQRLNLPGLIAGGSQWSSPSLTPTTNKVAPRSGSSGSSAEKAAGREPVLLPVR